MSTARVRAPLIYDDDGRREYYEVVDPLVSARFERSSVVLTRNEFIDQQEGRTSSAAPIWGARANICPGEAFSEQPGAAFCSGVLLDWDLVLTAGHCVHLFALSQFSVVFGYYYRESTELNPNQSVATPVEIVAEALDPEGVEPRLDYAWLRLARPVGSPYAPAPVYSKPAALAAGDGFTTIGAPGGVPLKFDDTGTVAVVREQRDFFTGRVDTSVGWSGGAAYDTNLVLLGILSRGGQDYVATPEGCNLVVHASSAEPADEQFTYGNRAVDALCAKQPTRALCRAECDPFCELKKEPTSVAKVEGGCAVAAAHTDSDARAQLIALAVLAMGCAVRRNYRTVKP
ncbi:MAG TPA: serine protease [Polyangiaceae bacterium]